MEKNKRKGYVVINLLLEIRSFFFVFLFILFLQYERVVGGPFNFHSIKWFSARGILMPQKGWMEILFYESWPKLQALSLKVLWSASTQKTI